MFGKLFKYDFKSNYKWYCITFAILLSLSILMGFITGSSLRPEVMERYSDYPMATSGVIVTLYLLFLLLFSASCAVFLSNTIIIIRRFYKNVFGREGYLTWTLPVTPHQILLSKLLSAFVWTLLCMLTMFISGLVIFGIALSITGYSFNEILKYIGEIPNLWLWIVKYGFLNLLQILCRHSIRSVRYWSCAWQNLNQKLNVSIRWHAWQLFWKYIRIILHHWYFLLYNS